MTTFLSEVIKGVQLQGRRRSGDINTRGRVLKGEGRGDEVMPCGMMTPFAAWWLKPLTVTRTVTLEPGGTSCISDCTLHVSVCRQLQLIPHKTDLRLIFTKQ